MWLLIATVCSSLEVSSCHTLYWYKETFVSEDKCTEAGVTLAPALVAQYKFVNPRCIEIPGQSA